MPAFYLNAFFATGNDTDAVNKKRSNRAINRHKWSKIELEKRLKSPKNIESLVFNSLKKLISIRKCQPAFHPNATQFTLQLDCCFFGIWRQSIDLSQNIYAITNVTHLEQNLSLSNLNLAFSDRWFDLISGNEMSNSASVLSFNPYQTYWISNERLCISEAT